MEDRIVLFRGEPGYEPVALPFAFAELPRRDCAPGGYKAIGAKLRWSRALPGGRRVRLASLHQYLTYGGVLCGLPDSDEVRAWPIEGAYRLALSLHPVMPWAVTLLAPELLRSKVTRQRDGRREVAEIDFLPPVCSIGVLASGSEEAVVIWFQDQFGPPEDGHVTRCLERVDWEKAAYESF